MISTCGLTSTVARDLLELHGPNKLAEEAVVPAWKKFVRQFANFLNAILIVAALVSLVVAREVKTSVVVFIVVVMNATIGFVQERKAESSLLALKKMLSLHAKVRRDDTIRSISAEEVVPGDVVILDTGDRVCADGQLLVAVSLEADESALTGESHPSEKCVVDVPEGLPTGEQHGSVFMNTTVTRGRGEFVVTSTGMNTKMGSIAGLLRDTAIDQSPLQKQLDHLAHNLAALAGVIVAVVFGVGLLVGTDISDLFVTAVALAVASIPEGLPAVTAVTLAIGVSRMARSNAIVKRLSSVETLGCTSVICSDKTGTLTLNQMTACELVYMNTDHAVDGVGYSPRGTIHRQPGDDPVALTSALLPMALCNDAQVHENSNGDWELIGDPTEGALLVLAMKGGLHVDDLRATRARIAEVPFDSSHKFMATFHQMVTNGGEEIVRAYVKGAPDVLLNKSSYTINEHGSACDISSKAESLLAHNHRLASQGLRVLAVAQRDFGIIEWDELRGEEPLALIDNLTLLALVGIIDPPRPEARDAISLACSAGIEVKMITGDHAITAGAIGHSLGLTGESVSGAELSEMSDTELSSRIDNISVFARVSPEHKIRLVTMLRDKGHVVAMTGDGVNDAPALKKADIGVAMGITGTEVTKEAATMVLTDDNFATIVTAVERGRTIYMNIVKFVRFQLSTTLGFALVFLMSSLLDIASRKPFTAIAILWVNIIMDGPPAMALGVDKPTQGTMQQPPRPSTEPILTTSRWTAVGLASTVMAIGTLGVFALAPGSPAEAGVASVAGTMGFNTFVLFQFFNILNVRNETRTVFSSETFSNIYLWASLGAVVLLQVLATHWSTAQTLFDTTDISLIQWLACIAVASSVLWVEEIHKQIARIKTRLRQ